MKIIRLFCFFAFMITLATPAIGQVDEAFDSIADNVLFRKEMSGSVIIHSNGWGLEFRTGTNRTVFKKLMIEVNLLEMKDAKEIRSINQFFTNTKSYYYGKLNAVYMIRAGIGQQQMLNRKPYFGGVEVRLFYSAGINAAFTKPVYLNIIKLDDNQYRYITVTERYDPEEHFPDNIYGRASFTKGFGELTFYPGAYAKAGLNIEFGTINQKPKMVEVGAALDIFPKAIPIMAFNSPQNYFLTLYISVGIGKRYN